MLGQHPVEAVEDVVVVGGNLHVRNGMGDTTSTNGSGNVIVGNYIGTDGTGMLDLGNTDRGVQIESGETIAVSAVSRLREGMAIRKLGE